MRGRLPLCCDGSMGRSAASACAKRCEFPRRACTRGPDTAARNRRTGRKPACVRAIHLHRALRPLDAGGRTGLWRIHHRDRRIRLPHRGYLPARARQSVPCQRRARNLFSFRLRGPALRFARLLCVEARASLFLCERGRAARPHARHPLHHRRQRGGGTSRCADRVGLGLRAARNAARYRFLGHLPHPSRSRNALSARSLFAGHHRQGHSCRHRDLRSQRASGDHLSRRSRWPHQLHRRPSGQFADPRLLRSQIRALAAQHGRRLQELAAHGACGRRAPQRRRLCRRPCRSRARQGHPGLFRRAVLRQWRAPAGRRLGLGHIHAQRRENGLLRFRARHHGGRQA